METPPIRSSPRACSGGKGCVGRMIPLSDDMFDGATGVTVTDGETFDRT
jgi:hypothetical protein